MNRDTFNFVIDALTMLVMFGLVATGLIVRFVLPPGSGTWHLVWGYSRHDWGGLHFWLALGTAVLVIVHTALHWPWVCAIALRSVRRAAGESEPTSRLRRNLVGLGLLAFLLVFFSVFVWVARMNVQEMGEHRHIRSQSQVDTHPSMTQAFLRGSQPSEISTTASQSKPVWA